MSDELDDEATYGEAQAGAVAIAHTDLELDTLRAVLEDLVTRDGTDYGAVEKTTEQKVATLMKQLERGEAKLVFDLATETIGLMTAEELARSKHELVE